MEAKFQTAREQALEIFFFTLIDFTVYLSRWVERMHTVSLEPFIGTGRAGIQTPSLLIRSSYEFHFIRSLTK